MESFNVSSNFENFAYINKQSTISPFSYLHIASSNSDSNMIALKECPKSIIKNHQSINNNKSFHQRCSSASSLLLNIEDDQPSWLDDLLTESESTTLVQHKNHHHSSSSDSWFIIEASYDNKSSSSEEKYSKVIINEKHNEEDLNGQSDESSGERSNLGSIKSNTTKTESKRAKQHSAHRSQVRKLKYISDLERTVQLLQLERSEFQAELEFLNQLNLILGMENIALKKHLDNASQEQLIKQFEQEMLERELSRLQTIQKFQNHKKMRIQQLMQA
ncbi:basic leucine zipper transcription factor [Lithospermum erythrorhizon]|uniref:Basic leucine zipper transcription factor n=1 Tax=Lithospermum erythrorhizon TaxID=34254 RepID=A0AAV3NTM0_LITER